MKRIFKNDFLNKKSFNVELSQKANFGDLSSNVALVLSKFLKPHPKIGRTNFN